MKTIDMLLAQYDGLQIIPIDRVCADYLRITPNKFLRKTLAGEIDLPIVRFSNSQKSAKGIHVADLAEFLDKRVAMARRERDKLCKRSAA